MRILVFLFTSLFILSGLTSCSSSDDDTPQEITLLGKWNVKQMTMEGNFVEDDIEVSFTSIADQMAGNDITFLENNTFTGNSAPFEMDINYVINGFPTTITQSANDALPVSGQWSKEGNFLYLQESGSERTKYTIETFTATTLKLSADQDSVDMWEDFENAQFQVIVTLER